MKMNRGKRQAIRRMTALMISTVLCVLICVSSAGAEKWYDGLTAEEIVSRMTIEQKASQMVQPACYNITVEEMEYACYGSILSQGAHLNAEEWQRRLVTIGFGEARMEIIVRAIADKEKIERLHVPSLLCALVAFRLTIRSRTLRPSPPLYCTISFLSCHVMVQ